MRVLFYIIIGSFVFFSSQIRAQTYIETTDKELVEEGKELTPETLSYLGIFTGINPRLQEITGNSVFLEQIGEMNEVNIMTRTEASEINVRQEGNKNNTSLKYIAKTAYTDIFQLGNYNTIKDFVNAPTEEISLELQQTGNDQVFERNGINELTKSIRFNQTEATPVLIINSYN